MGGSDYLQNEAEFRVQKAGVCIDLDAPGEEGGETISTRRDKGEEPQVPSLVWVWADRLIWVWVVGLMDWHTAKGE